MSDSFVPLAPSPARSREVTFTSMTSTGAAQPGASSSAGNGSGAAHCAKPVVTLQRNGEAVSSIRIQCSCGQVIELACAY